MEKLQVLVAAMDQTDLSLVTKMNLACSAIIANQTDHFGYDCENTDAGKVVMISTDTRGVGVNRNIALLASDSEFILFADDDLRYYDELEKNILSAFDENPKADAIIFGIDLMKNGEIYERRHLKNRRLRLWNSMRYGAPVLAARRSAIVKSGITFNTCFGGGCIYGSGEDSLFIKACFDKGLRVYSCEYVLGIRRNDSSSWFSGCDEKYFYDKGALMGCLFPRLKHLMALYFAVRCKRPTKIGCGKRIRLMLAGLDGVKKLIPYSEYAFKEQ